MRDAILIGLVALLVEAAVGYPQALYARIGHPVTWIGAVLARLDRRLNRERDGPTRRRLAGALALVLALLVSGGAGWLLTWAVFSALPRWAAILVLGVLASSCLAQRSLDAHVRAVADALEREGLEAGRRAVAMIVGRDTAVLDEAGVARAAIESLAENFSDGIVAPAFWLVLTGLPGGLAYKAANTADSMIGPSYAAPRGLRLGGGQVRRSRELARGTSRGPLDRGGRRRGTGCVGPRRVAHRASRLARPRLAQRRLARGSHGRRAGHPAGRRAPLRRPAGGGCRDGRGASRRSGPRRCGGHSRSTGWPVPLTLRRLLRSWRLL